MPRLQVYSNGHAHNRCVWQKLTPHAHTCNMCTYKYNIGLIGPWCKKTFYLVLSKLSMLNKIIKSNQMYTITFGQPGVSFQFYHTRISPSSSKWPLYILKIGDWASEIQAPLMRYTGTAMVSHGSWPRLSAPVPCNSWNASFDLGQFEEFQ